ncbi:hypothetical protein HDE_07751 [Halotydeus destructor]|nr:hypothetical protein HDE_07751 [Halotydeus destructor]
MNQTLEDSDDDGDIVDLDDMVELAKLLAVSVGSQILSLVVLFIILLILSYSSQSRFMQAYRFLEDDVTEVANDYPPQYEYPPTYETATRQMFKSRLVTAILFGSGDLCPGGNKLNATDFLICGGDKPHCCTSEKEVFCCKNASLKVVSEFVEVFEGGRERHPLPVITRERPDTEFATFRTRSSNSEWISRGLIFIGAGIVYLILRRCMIEWFSTPTFEQRNVGTTYNRNSVFHPPSDLEIQVHSRSEAPPKYDLPPSYASVVVR